MFTSSARLALLTLIAGLTVAGCADKPARHTTSTGSSHTTVTGASSRSSAVTKPKPATPAPPEISSNLPAKTGIAACDDYLASYVACHRAAGIYAPDQIESRYDQMRHSLIEDSQDPDMRPQLGTRCVALANQLHQVLHGKSCDGGAAANGGGQ
jgi:hypothetical protein